MAVTPIPDAPVVPQYPALGSLTFNQEAYAYGTAMPGVTQRIHEIAQAARSNAVESGAQAQAAGQERVAAVSETTAIKNAAVSETTAIKNAAVSETVAIKNAAVSETTAIKDAAVSETTTIKDAAVSETTTIANTARDYRDAAAASAFSAGGAANYQGEYDPGKTYTVGQSVSYSMRRFAAKRTVTGVTPVDGADWLMLRTGSSPTLQGNTAIYGTQTKTYKITNYNSFSSYTVSASAGTATISADTITFAAPAIAGSVDLTLTVDGQITVFVVTVLASVIGKPTNTSPVNGATVIRYSPTLQSSAFVTYGQVDTHLASRWTVYQGGTQVHSSGWRTDALTSYTVPAGVVAVSTDYTWTVEYRGTTLGDSLASTATSFTTAATFESFIPTPTPTPANFGDPLEGGFYAGMIWGQLVQSATSMTIATGSKTFTVPDMYDGPVVYQGQTVEVRSRANPANKFIGTVTGARGTSLTINVTSIGGSGTFSDWSVMARFRIIVAPKAGGEHAGIALKNANSALPKACQTLTEGFAATKAMRNDGLSAVYPAAYWARNLNIGGRTDWYIPARDELELCWRNLKPVTGNNIVTENRSTAASFDYANDGSYGDTANTHGTNNNSAPPGVAYTAGVPAQTAATAFRTGGAEAFEFGSAYYWSSSDYNATYAWCQGWHSSYPGYQFYNTKNLTYRVRAVRRSVI